MPRKSDKSKKVTDLRRQAEERLRTTRRDVAAMSAKDVQQLVHNLQVHQIELDLQNEELRRTRLELEVARDRYADLYDYSPVCLLTLDLSGTIVECNLTGAGLLGLNRQELIGQSLARFVKGEYRGIFHLHCQEMAKTGARQIFEVQLQNESGLSHWVHFDGTAVPSERGRITHWQAALLDISERKRRDEQFRLVVESSPNGLLMVDEGGTIILVNRQIERQFGYERAELIGQPLEMLLPQPVRSHHVAERGKFFAHSESRAMGKGRDLYGLRKGGQEFPLEIGLNPIRTPSGPNVLASVVDISDRKLAEQTLQRERDFIDAVLETAGALVVVLDRDGRVLRFNRACEQTTGYSFEEVAGRYVWDLFIIPDEVEELKALFQRLLGAELHNVHENNWKGRDGALRRISWSNTVLTDSNGKVDYIVAVGLDITELKQIQEQLRKTERIAELGTLASGMAHEIGTPMNVIIGRAEYLLQRTADEGMKRGLTTIITQIERITKVMNQLLAFARRKTPERRAVDLGEIMEDSLEMFQERMAHSRITVETTIEADLPPVYADRDQLVQVLINLVMNSLHAMPEGGRLRLSLGRENGHLRLGVSDTGHGMTEEIRSKVFEPFFTTKDFGKGTGLGLTVVKGIIEEHGGTIDVESVVDKGTTFWIRLPLDKAPVKR